MNKIENTKINIKKADNNIKKEDNIKRKNEIKKLIKSQTNYTDDIIEEKLLNWDNDYIKVIREYLNPNFEDKKKIEKNYSTNQRIFKEIRTFMDNINN